MFIYNHLDINVVYGLKNSVDPDSKIYIIAFEVRPQSRKYNNYQWEFATDKTQCPPFSNDLMRINNIETHNETIVWTYSVSWEHSDVPWSQRWNVYFGNSSEIHWMSIINSIVVFLLLAGIYLFIYSFIWVL